MWYESADSPSFNDPFSKSPALQLRPPRRVDTNVAPTEIHPGHHIPIPIDIEARTGSSSLDEKQQDGNLTLGHEANGVDPKHWNASPSGDSHRDELSQIRDEIVGLQGDESGDGFLRRTLKKLKRRKAPDYDANLGLRISVAGLAAHPRATLFLDAGLQRNKQRVFVATFPNGKNARTTALEVIH